MRGLITPIDPRTIFFFIQAGYPADFVLGLTVTSINGVRNKASNAEEVRPADPDFVRALQLLRELQAAGAFGVRVEEAPDRKGSTVLFLRRENLPADLLAKAQELRQLLHLTSGEEKFRLMYSPLPCGATDLCVQTRAMVQILSSFAGFVEVPDEHVADRTVGRAFENIPEREIGRIHSGIRKPEKAYAAVQYRGYWFWVDDSDWKAKRALTAVVFFFTLADTGGKDQLPVITIPAQ